MHRPRRCSGRSIASVDGDVVAKVTAVDHSTSCMQRRESRRHRYFIGAAVARWCGWPPECDEPPVAGGWAATLYTVGRICCRRCGSTMPSVLAGHRTSIPSGTAQYGAVTGRARRWWSALSAGGRRPVGFSGSPWGGVAMVGRRSVRWGRLDVLRGISAETATRPSALISAILWTVSMSE